VSARRLAISEAQLQANVIDTARLAGFTLVFHDQDSRRNPRGLPDLILLHPGTGRLVFVELKSATGKVRPDQKLWLAALNIRHEAYLWRPADWLSGEIQRVLLGSRIAAPAGAPRRHPSPAPATMGA
jgi:hypothetical protein